MYSVVFLVSSHQILHLELNDDINRNMLKILTLSLKISNLAVFASLIAPNVLLALYLKISKQLLCIYLK